MEYRKLKLIGEGKTKRLWKTDDDKHIIVEFSDDAMLYHAKKKLYFKDKARLCNEINSILMSLLEENNIPTDYICKVDENSILVKKAEMIPIEVVVRNYVAGSMSTRLGLEPHKKLKSPVLEFCYKNDELRDPVINEYHAYAMELCTPEELSVMCYQASRISKVLTSVMSKVGIVVADFKVEFGRVNGRLVVADELTPNVSRFWDAETLHKFENGDPSYEYREILRRLQSVCDKEETVEK